MSAEDRDKWNRRYREQGRYAERPAPFLLSLDSELPRSGRALDVAGGNGRHAIWLAERGLDVTLADVSEAGLELARRDAATAGVSLSTAVVDLETEPLPAGPWDLIVDFHFLRRELFPQYLRALAPGGMLVFCHQTMKNLERHAKPPRGFLLEDGELPSLLAGFDIVRYDERWQDEGRHEARAIARR
jgi:tellurite methyltransferase